MQKMGWKWISQQGFVSECPSFGMTSAEKCANPIYKTTRRLHFQHQPLLKGRLSLLYVSLCLFNTSYDIWPAM